MTEEQENKELSSDDEWQQVLVVAGRLWEEEHFDFVLHPLNGIPVSRVDETALSQHLSDAGMDASTFKTVFRTEVGPLLYPIVSDISDEDLVSEDSPFAELGAEQKEKLLKRRRELAQLLDADRLHREFDTKMSAPTEVLAGIEVQLYRAGIENGEDASRSPVALLTVSADVPIGGSALSMIFRGLFETFPGGRGRKSVTMTCTRNDIQYLRRRLGKIEQELLLLEEEENEKAT